MFLLGTHRPNWLREVSVPLFVSDTRMRSYVHVPVASTDWALDSGGFTELQRFGAWTVTPDEYAARVRRYRDETGNLMWAAPQDWMCEPIIINGGHAGPITFAGTHLSVAEHQRRTVDNLIHLRTIAPDLSWVPVIQGFTRDEYLACVDLYDRYGIDLTAEPLVGLGSVCRRQNTSEIHEVIRAVRSAGLTRLHGFGCKSGGLERYGHLLTSADSLAWSMRARKAARPMAPCTHEVPKNCANCQPFALRWRANLLAGLPTSHQLAFDDAA